MSGSNPWLGFFYLAIALAIYFIPTFVAAKREHQSGMAIAALNFFLGWTFLGWVIALVWSLTEVRKREKI